ncbi:HlyD family secretion protein [Martelella mediterranea]|uniref:HlyD family secretion protein n=1 Tax=Martelella mediterranea TaxID=293089 RepID=A0A4R3NRL5_9HYPH|nr:HlyD family efflux transporter periplasmic adaptor subunit [Martelella mediterranea]TCT37852.1 HlyD family secretion protein [Martelella mediterranea]
MKRILAILVLIAVVSAIGWYYLRPQPESSWLGWIEADMVYVGSSSTARLTGRFADEGDAVSAGKVLLTFESDAEAAAVQAAHANLAKSEAALDLARAPQDRPEQLKALNASREEAEAALAYADKSLSRAKELYRQQSGTKANLDNAISSYAQAKAALDKINAQIALGRRPQRDQQITQAEQAVAAASADLASAEAVLALKTVAAPQSGLVQETYYRVGEVVPAGRPVIALLPPENVRVEFFIPEQERASLHVGDTIDFNCDGCSAQTAQISFIAQEAEYTPPEIFSREERSKMVYRARAVPQSPEGLAVGLPVNVSAGSAR